MGAIQGAINSALGTVATAAAAGKHFKNQAEQIKSSELGEMATLNELVPKNEEEIQKLQEDITGASTQLDQEIDEFNFAKEEGSLAEEDYDPLSGKYKQEKSIEKHQLALKTMQGQINAKSLQNSIYKERLNALTKKYGGNK